MQHFYQTLSILIISMGFLIDLSGGENWRKLQGFRSANNNAAENWNNNDPALGSANDELKEHELTLPGIPRFEKAPPEISYVMPGKSVQIVCIADPANFVNIFCNGKIVERNKMIQNSGEVRPSGGSRLKFYVDVSFRDVHEWFGKEDYWCQCEAWNQVPALQHTPKKIRSPKAFIKISYLEDRFQFSPMSKRVDAKSPNLLQMQCTPPQGIPPPKVFWQVNGKNLLLTTKRFTIDHQKSLIIQPVRLSDAGNYTCVAENVAGRLVSETAILKVYQNGQWSSWSTWTGACPSVCFLPSLCHKECSSNRRERVRFCNNPVPLEGGDNCKGTTNEVEDCDHNCDVNGEWSTWSSWSTCDTDCQQIRHRSCNNPLPKNKGLDCSGSHSQTQNCTTEASCSIRFDKQQQQAVTKKDMNNIHDVAMYVGLFVAIAVLVTVIGVIAYLVRRKLVIFTCSRFNNSGGDIRFRNHVNGENSHSSAKSHKGHDLLIPPDFSYTHNVVSNKSNSCSGASSLPLGVNNNLWISAACSSSASSSNPSQRGLQVVLPNSTTYQSIGKVGKCTMYNGVMAMSGGSLAAAQHSNCSSCGSQICENIADKSRPCSALYHELSLGRHSQVFANIGPANVDVEAMAWGTVGSDGGRLCLPESGISLTIPNGSLAQGQSEEFFLAVCRDENDRPRLSDGQTVLSPIVLCGPSGIGLAKPLVLSFPHSAYLSQGFWSVTLLCCECSGTAQHADDNAWQEMVRLGQETLNTPVFCQLDNNMCHLMTEQMKRYCLIGESMAGGNAVKALRLAAFAAPLGSSLDYSLRVYILADTRDAFENVVNMENKLGGYLMDSSKQLLFRDGGHGLCFCIEELSLGWRSKAKYQEIPFQHIWSGNQSGTLHCSFSLEHVDPTRQSVSCKIVVYQNHFYGNRQVVHIISNKNDLPQQQPTAGSITSRTSCSSGLSSSAKVSPPRIVPPPAMQLAPPLQSTFRLSAHLRQNLCHQLDTPNSRANDWRLLARQLGVDRYINYFATKPSPTECIFDLWEARNREDTALCDLITALQTMGRNDCAAMIEAEFSRLRWSQ